MNQTAVALCRDLSLSSHEAWVAMIWAWWGVSICLTLGLVIFTAAKARIKAKEIGAGFDRRSVSTESEESEEDRRHSSMYQTIPEDYVERKRGSDLEDIAEAEDECYYEDESDLTDSSPPSRGSSSSVPSPAPPTSLQHLQLPAIQRDAYLRSHSAGDEIMPPRASLLGPGPLVKKGTRVKRTESQNRADYLLRVNRPVVMIKHS